MRIEYITSPTPTTYILTVSMDSEGDMLGQGPFRIPRTAVRGAICDDEGEMTGSFPEVEENEAIATISQ
jgi:hypothetical protein